MLKKIEKSCLNKRSNADHTQCWDTSKKKKFYKQTKPKIKECYLKNIFSQKIKKQRNIALELNTM